MGSYEFLRGIDRRDFLRVLSATGVGGLVYPRELIAGLFPSAVSRVVVVEDGAATAGLTIKAGVVQAMVDAGIRSLGGRADVGEAWKVLLPGVSAASRIALKVNCINSSMSTHPAVAYAVAASLQRMMFGGAPFPANNIVIYDRTTGELQGAGYTLNSTTAGVRCLGTNSSGVGYTSTTYSVAGSNQRVSKVVTTLCDFLVNLSVLKNHGGAGVTLCLKNHFGTCDNPGALHGGLCDPYAAALSAIDPIRAKQRVFICDALFGVRTGGPGGSPQFTANRLIMSADIVAADYQGRALLAQNGCVTTGDAHHIETAAATYALGTANPALMDVVNVRNPSTTGVGGGPLPRSFRLEQNFPNPFNPSTVIPFSLPESAGVRLTVHDLLGREVAVLMEGPLAAGSHAARWDASGFASGLYLCRLRAGDYDRSIIMHLLR